MVVVRVKPRDFRYRVALSPTEQYDVGSFEAEHRRRPHIDASCPLSASWQPVESKFLTALQHTKDYFAPKMFYTVFYDLSRGWLLAKRRIRWTLSAVTIKESKKKVVLINNIKALVVIDAVKEGKENGGYALRLSTLNHKFCLTIAYFPV